MLDPLQFYCRVLCNGMKMRFRMVMIAHPVPGIGFHKRFMSRIILPPTTSPAPARISSKIDLKHAYHLVFIAEGDEPKTAFCTHYDSYKWRVMPFRLSNTPAAFQRFINEVLGDLMDVCTVGYLDDILIYSDSLEDH